MVVLVVVNSVVVVWEVVSFAPSAFVVDIAAIVVSSVVVSVYALVVLSVEVTNEVFSKKSANNSC